MKVSILQWNVLYTEKGDNVMQLITEVDADIVCLQELTQNSVTNPNRDLPAEIGALGYHTYYEPTDSRPDQIIGNGIFSKFPLLDSQAIYVSRADPSNQDYPQYNRAYVESVADLGETQLTIGVTHLSYSPEFIFFPAKLIEAKKFIDIVSPHKHHYVLTGDFNATPDSGLIKDLDKLLIPAGPDYAEATWTTKPFEMHGFSADTLNWRLDYVFTTADIKVLTSKILQTDASDHLPILTKIEI